MTSSKVPWRDASPLCERGKIEYQLAKARPRALGVDRDLGRGQLEGPRVGGHHRRLGVGRQQDGETRRVVGGEQPLGDRLQPRRRLPRGGLRRAFDEAAALLEFERDGEAGIVLGFHLVVEHGEVVAPGLDHVEVAAEALQGQVGGEAVVAERRHAALAPPVLVGGAPAQRHRDAVVPLREGVGLDPHDFADRALDGVAAAVDRGRDRLDGEARRRHGGLDGEAQAVERRHDGGAGAAVEHPHGRGGEADRRVGAEVRPRAHGVAERQESADLGRQRAGRQRRHAVERRVDEHEPRRRGGAEVAGVDAQHARRGAGGGADEPQRPAGEAAALARHEGVGGAHGFGELKKRGAAQRRVGFPHAARRRHALAGAELQAHRHEEAVAERRRDRQSALDGPPSDLVGDQRPGQALAEGRFREGDDGAERAQPLVLVDRPGGAAVPPAQGREGAVEAGGNQGRHRLGRQARRPGEQACAGRGAAHGVAHRGPQGGGDALGREAAEAGHAGLGQRRRIGHQHSREAGADRLVGEGHGGSAPRLGRHAGVERVGGRRGEAELARQRGAGRDPVGREVDRQGEAAGAAELRQGGERFGDRVRRRERRMWAGPVGRQQRIAGRPRRAGRRHHHAVEAHAGAAVEDGGPFRRARHHGQGYVVDAGRGRRPGLGRRGGPVDGLGGRESSRRRRLHHR